jgi:hypothetical protein
MHLARRTARCVTTQSGRRSHRMSFACLPHSLFLFPFPLSPSVSVNTTLCQASTTTTRSESTYFTFACESDVCFYFVVVCNCDDIACKTFALHIAEVSIFTTKLLQSCPHLGPLVCALFLAHTRSESISWRCSARCFFLAYAWLYI